jgi:hypothetical protein
MHIHTTTLIRMYICIHIFTRQLDLIHQKHYHIHEYTHANICMYTHTHTYTHTSLMYMHVYIHTCTLYCTCKCTFWPCVLRAECQAWNIHHIASNVRISFGLIHIGPLSSIFSLRPRDAISIHLHSHTHNLCTHLFWSYLHRPHSDTFFLEPQMVYIYIHKNLHSHNVPSLKQGSLVVKHFFFELHMPDVFIHIHLKILATCTEELTFSLIYTGLLVKHVVPGGAADGVSIPAFWRVKWRMILCIRVDLHGF